MATAIATVAEVEQTLVGGGVPAEVARIDADGMIHLTNGYSFATHAEVQEYANGYDPLDYFQD